jgi:hypothetical protein
MTQDESQTNSTEKPKPPDFLFAITILPTFNVAQNGINLEATSEFSTLLATADIDYDFLAKADDRRLQQHITTEVMQMVQGLQITIRDVFGPELIEHLTGAFGAAREIARQRNGKADVGLSEENDRGKFQAEE